METIYAGDPRVSDTEAGDGFVVYLNGTSYRILRTGGRDFGDGWGIFVEDGEGGFEVLRTERGNLCVDYLTADAAIGDLLGEPCVAGNEDGTFTVVADGGGDWLVWDVAGRPGWCAMRQTPYAWLRYYESAADAVNAVLGDPEQARKVEAVR